MLGTRRKELPQNRIKPKRLSSNVYLISDECVELRKSVSLTSSSSYTSDDDLTRTNSKHKVSNFMKNAAPSVVTKYITKNKMDSPFVEKERKCSGLYERSILSTALAIKAGKGVSGDSIRKSESKIVDRATAKKSGSKATSTTQSMKAVSAVPTNTIEKSSDETASFKTDNCSTATSKRTILRMKRNVVIDSDHSIITQVSSLSINSGNTRPSQKNASDSLTPLQKRALKVKKFKENKGSIVRAAGLFDDLSKKNAKYEAWKTTRSSNVDAREVEEDNSVAQSDNLRVMPSASDSSSVKHDRAVLEKAKTVRSLNDQYELLAKVKVAPPPPPLYKPSRIPRDGETPFDECKEKVEVVALANETVIIDKSRDVQHTVRDESEEATQRRMELIDRARSLISRTDSASVDRM